MSNFSLKLITPQGVAYEGSASQVSLSTPEGQMTILADHMPIMTILSPGEITLKDGPKEHFLSTEGGMAYFSKNNLKILADTAESAESLDQVKIEEARKKASEMMANAQDEIEFAHAEALLEKQLAKISFIKKRKRR